MNWPIYGRTQDIVGEDPSEGSRCDHLVDGEQAYGYVGEADGIGEERHYFCKSCYEQFIQNRLNKPTECDYCKQEWPLRLLHRYTPWMIDGSHAEREHSKRWICTWCRDSPDHRQRLLRDKEERGRDCGYHHDND